MNMGLLDNLITAETVLLALKEQFAEPEDPAWCFDAEKVSTLVQGLDLMTLLMRDAAVQSFLEQVDRVARQPRYNFTGAPSQLSH